MKTTKVIAQSIDQLDNYRKIVFWGLVVLLFLVLSCRLMLIVGVVMNGSMQKSMKATIDSISLEVQDLEHKYISAKGEITNDYAKSLGYTEPAKVNYISLTQTPVNLSLNIR